jgi:gas vesicle protein
MFAGPLADTHNAIRQKVAEGLEEHGYSPENIHKMTGLHRAVGGKWVHEISDQGLKLNEEELAKTLHGQSIPIQQVLQHDELLKAYPTLMKNLKVKMIESPTAGGHYDPANHTILINDPSYLRYLARKFKNKEVLPEAVLAHEVQHAIQHYEGMPAGDNVSRHMHALELERSALEEHWDRLNYQELAAADKGHEAAVKEFRKAKERVNEQLMTTYSPEALQKEAVRLYNLSAGEQQAGNVQTRLRMTPEERAASFPPSTMTAPLEDQLVRYNTDTPSFHQLPPSKQGGFATPEQMKRLAITAGAAVAGATLGAKYLYPNNQSKGAMIGAGLAVLAAPVLSDFLSHPIRTVRTSVNNLRDSMVYKKGEDISAITQKWQSAALRGEVTGHRMQNAMQKLAPSEASQIKIAHWLDGDKSIQLTPEEMKAALIGKSFDDTVGKMAQDAGVINNLIENHISHLWKQDDAAKAYMQLAQAQASVTAALSPNSRFDLARQFKSLRAGKEAGLTPVTENASKILGTYAKSVFNSIRNKALLDALKNTKDSTGQSKLLLPTKVAGRNYVTINHPQLRGWSIHPSIATDLRNIFYSYDLNPIETAISALNMAQKRATVSFSAFHLTSLADAASGGLPTLTHPIGALKNVVQSVTKSSPYMKALRGEADTNTQALFDRFLDSGAVPQIPHGRAADVDINNNFYQSLSHIQEYMDRAVPYSGKLVEGVAWLNHKVDHILFERAMSSLKFSLWSHQVGEMSKGYTKLAERNPSARIPLQSEIDRMAGGYVNNLLGGQNWLQAAQEATTSFGRAYLTALGSPTGRKVAQYMMFAPDWTTSTVMSLTKALGKGSEQFGTTPMGKVREVLQGIKEPKTVADLHRQYQLRSALLYAIIGGTINYLYSGKFLWENKDPTTIDLGNGQHLQWNKHWVEPYQLATEPAKSIVNKSGPLVKEAMEQVLNKEYLNPEGYSPPMQEGRLAHAMQNFMPIPFQNMDRQTPESMFWNLVGRNVVGTTTEQQRKMKEEKKIKARETRRNKRLHNMYGEK